MFWSHIITPAICDILLNIHPKLASHTPRGITLGLGTALVPMFQLLIVFFNTDLGNKYWAFGEPPSPSKTSWFYARSAPLENLAYHSETVLLCKNVLMMCHFNRKGVLVCTAYSTQFKLALHAELNDGTFAPTLAKVGAQPPLIGVWLQLIQWEGTQNFPRGPRLANVFHFGTFKSASRQRGWNEPLLPQRPPGFMRAARL